MSSVSFDVRRRMLARVLCVALAFHALPAAAQVGSALAPGTAFPVSIVSPDSASSVALNPSALGSVDGWSIAYSHVSAVDRSVYADRTDALWLAADVGKIISLGAGLDVVRSRTRGLPDSTNGVLGASFNMGPYWSWGATWRIRSPRNEQSNLHTADVGLSFRPSSTLAVSLIGRDLAREKLWLGTQRLKRSGVLAIVTRPLGDDRLMLEVSGLVDQDQRMAARVAAQGMVPWVGRVGAAGEYSETSGHPAWTFTAGVDLRWGGISVAPGLHGVKGGDLGWSLLVDMHAQPRIGVPAPRYVAKVATEDTGSRGLLSIVRALDRALHDPRIKGVVLSPTDTGLGLAGAQEIRLLVNALQAAGKPVYCHLEAASGSEFYACAGAQRVSIDPAGYVKLLGVSSDALYFGKVLRDAGIRTDFVRIGRYKSAPEQYVNEHASEGAREQRTQLLDDAYARLVYDLAQDTARGQEQVKSLFEHGLFLPREAIQAKLVDAEVDLHDLSHDAEALYGGRVHVVDQGKRGRHPRFGPTGQIGVVVVDGSIVDGENVDVPFLDIHMSGGRTVVEAIDRMAANSRIRAIVLRVDSPGGAAMASDQIWRAVQRARKKKPVIASMGDVAASGGYYVASAANEIWASPSTITGSIGIYYGKVDIEPLARHFGVNVESDKRGPHAGAESLFRPFTDDDRAQFAERLRAWYRQFLERVATGRKMPIERVDELARGHVYSGDTAHSLGLVDSLGGFGAALARARELAGLPIDAEIVVQPQRPSTLLDYVLGTSDSKAQSEVKAALPAAFKPFLNQLFFMSRLVATEPVALYEGPLQLR